MTTENDKLIPLSNRLSATLGVIIRNVLAEHGLIFHINRYTPFKFKDGEYHTVVNVDPDAVLPEIKGGNLCQAFKKIFNADGAKIQE
jgi:hypothetical protein